MEKQHIFMSYNRSDSQWMRQVKTTFEEDYGLRVWTDEGIPPDSANWLKSIQGALKSAYCLVCILSPETANSDWVMEELFFAKTNKMSIYMILVDGDLESSSIFGFSASQVTDVTDPDIYDDRLESLADAIKRKHITKNENTMAFSTSVLKRINEAFREEEEKQRIDIPDDELHMLIVRQGAANTPRTRYQITETPCLLGRDETNIIIVRDTYISRNHCDFLYTADGMWVRDLDSSNGTYVDGEQIEDKRLLTDGNQITFAQPELQRKIELVYYCKENIPANTG